MVLSTPSAFTYFWAAAAQDNMLSSRHPFHILLYNLSWPFRLSPSSPPFSICHNHQCFPRCSSSPFSPHLALLGFPSIPFLRDFLMGLSRSAVSTSEAGSSSRCVAILSDRHVLHSATATQPWITPSLFDDTGNPAIVDEWTFTQYQDRKTAQATLMNHWDTWITEADLESIAKAGLVRCMRRL